MAVYEAQYHSRPGQKGEIVERFRASLAGAEAK